MTGSSKKAKIAAKIRALLAKTRENGCTEQEALEAAAKAAELMQEYQISLSDAELLEDGFVESFLRSKPKADMEAYTLIGSAIAMLTGTKCIQQTEFETGLKSYYFFGLQQDADFATWLCHSLGDFILAGCTRYILEEKAAAAKRISQRSYRDAERKDLLFDAPVYEKPKTPNYTLMKKSYIWGAATQICERIAKIIKEREEALRNRPAGTALVLRNKQMLVSDALDKRGIRLSKARTSTTPKRFDGSAFDKGMKRGDEARFDRPVNKDSEIYQIGL
ncbi:MAG TPA: DUF2786 domain-containing protein [Hyphomicrobiales bacterium]|nr:DUF2786 domain-containing protein [Hyphomicrobiales bacterium]